MSKKQSVEMMLYKIQIQRTKLSIYAGCGGIQRQVDMHSQIFDFGEAQKSNDA